MTMDVLGISHDFEYFSKLVSELTSRLHFQKYEPFENADGVDEDGVISTENDAMHATLNSGARRYFVNTHKSSNIPAFKLNHPQKSSSRMTEFEHKESLSAAELKLVVSKKLEEIRNKRQASSQISAYTRLPSDKPSRSELRKIAISKNQQNSSEAKSLNGLKSTKNPNSASKQGKSSIAPGKKHLSKDANRYSTNTAVDKLPVTTVSQNKKGKFDLSGKTEIKPIVPVKRDLSQRIQKLLEKKAKIQKLEKSDPEKAARISEKEVWSNAIARAQGAKIMDDPNLLKKALKRKQQKKAKSSKEWKQRLEFQRKKPSSGKKRPGFEGVNFKKSKTKK